MSAVAAAYLQQDPLLALSAAMEQAVTCCVPRCRWPRGWERSLEPAILTRVSLQQNAQDGTQLLRAQVSTNVNDRLHLMRRLDRQSEENKSLQRSMTSMAASLVKKHRQEREEKESARWASFSPVRSAAHERANEFRPPSGHRCVCC